VPSGDGAGEDSTEDAFTPLGELFYRGTLIRLTRGGSFGVVRSARDGREIPFERQHVTVLGASGAGQVELREGMAVGYDVGWTSRGLRVTKLFPAPDEVTDLTAADRSGT
jgi:hypothetical protein